MQKGQSHTEGNCQTLPFWTSHYCHSILAKVHKHQMEPTLHSQCDFIQLAAFALGFAGAPALIAKSAFPLFPPSTRCFQLLTGDIQRYAEDSTAMRMYTTPERNFLSKGGAMHGLRRSAPVPELLYFFICDVPE